VSNKASDRDEELTAGQMFGRYELLMPIAKGGMGNVWAARLKGSRGFRKLVAIKTILRTLHHADQERMLFQEAVLASQIHHPNVAETLELGEQDDTLYLVMELVSGESLRFVMQEAQARGGMPILVCINVIGQICRGLAAAHDLRDKDGERVGLVHRDISPPNIMITDAGTVKIVDFGVATTSSSGCDAAGEIRGKISYLAPEQLQGAALDARVDVFATGILLYLLTVGRHPFRAATESSTMARILSKAPATTPSVLIEDYPDALEQIVMCALHKDREQRFQSITAMLEALENAYSSAFGPRADEATALYLVRLMQERILERKASLRMAEEAAEKSSRISAHSLPGVATSEAPRAKSNGSALFGLGGLFIGLGAAALAGTLYLQELGPAALRGAVSFSQRELPAAAVKDFNLALPAQIGVAAGGASPLLPAIAALPTTLTTSSAPRPKRTPSGRSIRDQAADDDPIPGNGRATDRAEPAEGVAEASVAAGPPLTAAYLGIAQTEAEPALAGSHPRVLELDPSHALLALAPATAAAPLPLVKAAPATPRLLSSRLGQNQLLTSPSAASRVRLPVGLDRMGETFSALVNICVTATGSVSRVSILRSAGPVLDPQIPKALSRWRYRPLVEGGTPTPFCYNLNYEISAR